MQNIAIMIDMLKKGKNGEEILKILDTITESDSMVTPTASPIDF